MPQLGAGRILISRVIVKTKPNPEMLTSKPEMLISMSKICFVGAFYVLAGTAPFVPYDALAADKPDAQIQFERVLCEFRDKFYGAANEASKRILVMQRDQALAKVLTDNKAENWVGFLNALDASSSLKLYVSVQIGCRGLLKTWNNEFSDSLSGTMLVKTDPGYDEVLASQINDELVFSGMFLSADGKKIAEQSITIDGSLSAPEFTFRFSDIKPIQ